MERGGMDWTTKDTYEMNNFLLNTKLARLKTLSKEEPH